MGPAKVTVLLELRRAITGHLLTCTEVVSGRTVCKAQPGLVILGGLGRLGSVGMGSSLGDSIMWDCSITNEGCVALASALRTNSSHLRELNLNNNKTGKSGMKQLSEILNSPHCKLETLQGRHSESSLSTYPYLLHPQHLHPLASYPH
ncbi:hypothetical protein QTP70_000708 [Hemibagrus guttatus]|uniref:Uncharacterized protein n=1 Tax=Hemibagrus guttatus TaxID=175788 RepID=A0AAE0UQD5_9TELE|nr:hypothetical protein QTP70_000708 [Hemibagrus guttatus]